MIPPFADIQAANRQLRRFFWALLGAAGLLTGEVSAQTQPVPLPRLGLRLSGGVGDVAANVPGYIIGLEANRWLLPRLSIGLGAWGGFSNQTRNPNYFLYDNSGSAQVHVSFTLVRERPISINIRAGAFLRAGLSNTNYCDDCYSLDNRYRTSGLMVGIYPTYRLSERWSCDLGLEYRLDRSIHYMLVTGVKFRIPARATTEDGRVQQKL